MCINKKLSTIKIREVYNGENLSKETEKFHFFKIPKSLIKDEQFKNLSNDAKLLYSLMLDRLHLSIKNGWHDDENRVYIYYTMHEIMEDLNCSNPTCTKILGELDSKKGIGLIERKKQGQGKPDIIYVKTLVESIQEDIVCEYESEQNRAISETKIFDNKKQKNVDAKSKENKSQATKKICTNNTNESKNKWSKNESIHLSQKENKMLDEKDWIEEYRNLIRENISYERLIAYLSIKDKELVEELYELICDIVCVPKKKIRIGGEDISYEIVKAQFLKLNETHIEYVLESLNKNAGKIVNIKAYLLTTLYNAVLTINHYYHQEVQYDMYG